MNQAVIIEFPDDAHRPPGPDDIGNIASSLSQLGSVSAQIAILAGKVGEPQRQILDRLDIQQLTRYLLRLDGAAFRQLTIYSNCLQLMMDQCLSVIDKKYYNIDAAAMQMSANDMRLVSKVIDEEINRLKSKIMDILIGYTVFVRPNRIGNGESALRFFDNI